MVKRIGEVFYRIDGDTVWLMFPVMVYRDGNLIVRWFTHPFPFLEEREKELLLWRGETSLGWVEVLLKEEEGRAYFCLKQEEREFCLPSEGLSNHIHGLLDEAKNVWERLKREP